MAIRITETWDSRKMGLELDNAQAQVEYIVTGTSDHLEAYNAVLAFGSATFEGLTFKSLSVDPLGGPNWVARLDYGVSQVGQTIPGQAGVSPPPPAPPHKEETEALTDQDGVTFTTVMGETHINRSLDTVRRISLLGTSSATTEAERAEGGAYPGADVKYSGALPPDRGGTIGEEGEGCDLGPGTFRYVLTRNMPTISNFYIKRLADMTGKVNRNAWRDFKDSEVLFLGADGEFRGPQGWKVNYYFDVSRQTNIVFKGDIVGVLPPHHYAWSSFEKIEVLGVPVLSPAGIYLEQVYESDFFVKLRI